MTPTIPGIHHVTAITADAQKNIDFYCGALGLRLVKLTVNFDDPQSYHLYYGDDLGRPGTIMTFFAWPGGQPGRIGPPQVTSTTFAAPEGSSTYWLERLQSNGVVVELGGKRFGDEVLSFVDPDGMKLEIVFSSASPQGATGPVPNEHAFSGFHSAVLSEEGHESTARLLTEVMGFRGEAREGNRFRYRAGDGQVAAFVDLLCVPDAKRGIPGAG